MPSRLFIYIHAIPATSASSAAQVNPARARFASITFNAKIEEKLVPSLRTFPYAGDALFSVHPIFDLVVDVKDFNIRQSEFV